MSALLAEIPLWGFLGAICAAIVAFVTVRSQLTAHEQLDEKRFEAIENRFSEQDDMLKEIRGDIKTLIQRHK